MNLNHYTKDQTGGYELYIATEKSVCDLWETEAIIFGGYGWEYWYFASETEPTLHEINNGDYDTEGYSSGSWADLDEVARFEKPSKRLTEYIKAEMGA